MVRKWVIKVKGQYLVEANGIFYTESKVIASRYFLDKASQILKTTYSNISPNLCGMEKLTEEELKQWINTKTVLDA